MPPPSPVISFKSIDPTAGFSQPDAEVWDRLRIDHPIAWCEGQSGGFWVISRYQDVLESYRDTARLSSRGGNVVTAIQSGGDAASGRMLVVTDPPRHGEVRRILQPAFSARALERVHDSVATATRKAISALLAQGGGDFATEVAAKIPLITMCELFDVPDSDRQGLSELTMIAMGTDQAAVEASAAAAAKRELLHYYAGLLTERQEAPGDDLVSLMATTQPDATSMSTAEVVLNCYNIIIGGNETSRFVSSGAALAFAEYPDQWARFRSDTQLLDTAIEEVLRWTTPATHVARTATVDILFRGVTIKAGDIVTLWNSSANFDPGAFPEPYAFDIGRFPNKHLALGHGPHFCLGSWLARMELRSLLTELRAQVATMRLDGRVERIYSNVLAGISSLPLQLEA